MRTIAKWSTTFLNIRSTHARTAVHHPRASFKSCLSPSTGGPLQYLDHPQPHEVKWKSFLLRLKYWQDREGGAVFVSLGLSLVLRLAVSGLSASLLSSIFLVNWKGASCCGMSDDGGWKRGRGKWRSVFRESVDMARYCQPILILKIGRWYGWWRVTYAIPPPKTGQL